MGYVNVTTGTLNELSLCSSSFTAVTSQNACRAASPLGSHVADYNCNPPELCLCLDALQVLMQHNACEHAASACGATATTATQGCRSEDALGVLEEM